MSVTTKENVKSYSCDGVQKDFGFPFSIIGTDTDVLKVTLWEDATSAKTELTENSGTYSYTVSAPNNNYENGGTVSTTKLDGVSYVAYAWPAGYTITIERIVAYNQPSQFSPGGLDSKALEQTFDHQEYQVQQLYNRLLRSIKGPPSDPLTTVYEIPGITARANMILGFDASGNIAAIASVPSVAATAWSKTLLDDDSALAARNTLEIYKLNILESGCEPSTGFFFQLVGSYYELFYVTNGIGGKKQLTSEGKLNVEATEAVLLTGDQTITGAKSFSSPPVLPAAGDGLVPVGSMLQWLTDTAPAGWLLCYGQAVSRENYSGLFTIISTTFGVGDGSTTFNLPDLRGRLPLGQDNMGGVSANRITSAQADAIGGAAGAEDHQLITAEMPAHTHSLKKYGTGGDDYGPPSAASDPHQTGSTGGDGTHNNVQPYLTTNYIIKY